MTSIKDILKNTSLYRKLYIITLLLCRIVFIQILAYVFTALLFVWGTVLVFYNERRYRTFFNMHFGLWVGGFILVVILSMFINLSVMFPVSFLYLLHILICFFIFYSIHTEPDFNFREELGFLSKSIVYIVTVCNLIGLFFLLFGISFQFELNLFGIFDATVPFIVFENRFTSVFTNPNQLAFISVTALVCLHMLSKQSLRDVTGKINNAWVVLCAISSLFATLLSDSNASFVLLVGYVIVYLAYMFFTEKKKNLNVFNTILRVISVILISVVIVFSSQMFRTIFNTGFAVVTSQANSLVDIIFRDNYLTDDMENSALADEEEPITFTHENKNIDSGRFKLWNESFELFKLSPVVGISNGNIIYYSTTRLNSVFKYDLHYSDPHNGFLSILVSTGALGFILFCIFGFRFTKHCSQHLFLKGDEYKEEVFPCMFSFLASYLVFSLFEITLLYDISYMVMFFWLIMGYTSTYIVQKEYMLRNRSLFHSRRLKRTLL